MTDADGTDASELSRLKAENAAMRAALATIERITREMRYGVYYFCGCNDNAATSVSGWADAINAAIRSEAGL